MVKLTIFAFCLLIMQVGLTYLQVINYHKRLYSLKTLGIMGIGNKKGKIAAGSIIILISNKDGIIIDCEEMKGRTVFSRFNKVNKYIGLSIYSLKTFHQNNIKYKKSAIAKAIQSIEQQLSI
jgi:glucitol operon activator protein